MTRFELPVAGLTVMLLWTGLAAGQTPGSTWNRL